MLARPGADCFQAGAAAAPVMEDRHGYTPDGRCVSLLNILLTNFCAPEHIDDRAMQLEVSALALH
jgi:predicted DNA-binding helix-hairpin-helix protein